MSNRYDESGIGCYVDGTRGIYATDQIVEIAEAHGFIVDHDDDGCDHEATTAASTFAGCEFAGEIEDEASKYMDDKFGVVGCYWGRSEGDDWGLWPADEDEITTDSEAEVFIAVQINGKTRDVIRVEAGSDEASVIERARESTRVKRHLDGKAVRRTIYVKDRLLNFVASGLAGQTEKEAK